MDVYIDSAPFATSAATLGEIIEEAKKPVMAGGRLIVEVRVDGRSLTEEELYKLAPTTLDGVEELQLVTADPLELSIAIVHSVGGALHEAREAQKAAAAAFAADDTPAALAHVKQAFSVWHQAQQTVQQTSHLIRVPMKELSVNGQTVPEIIDDLARKLHTVRDQLVASDWVGLSDSMAYDLDAAAETWGAMLQLFRQHLESQRK